ncbi:MAG: hypothetical protein JWO95_285 [Verrucomicrobiales bacterium]|nr:hypothetical protein [Verrucomicrobiales bacterium]
MLASLLSRATAADLVTSGDWTRQINAADLSRGAGSHLISQHESPVGVTLVSVSNTSGGAWRLKVRRSGGLWHSNVGLRVRRCGDGSGTGYVTGGEPYVDLSNIDAQICSGAGDRSYVSLQFEIVGVSTTLSPASYNTSVVFTLE